MEQGDGAAGAGAGDTGSSSEGEGASPAADVPASDEAEADGDDGQAEGDGQDGGAPGSQGDDPGVPGDEAGDADPAPPRDGEGSGDGGDGEGEGDSGDGGDGSQDEGDGGDSGAGDDPDPGDGDPGGATCGGIASLPCGDGEFCNYETEAGGQGCDGTIADAAGVCQTRPDICTADYRPVCGCDRRTYSNRCSAHAAGMSVMRDGACTDRDCAEIGGRAVDGIGPPPMCEPDEENYGFITYESGVIAIEGTICCVPR